MKENIEDEVITLADGKTANNLRGAALAGIGVGETDDPRCGAKWAQCGMPKDLPCCEGKFICLKLVIQRRAFHFISFSILYE